MSFNYTKPNNMYHQSQHIIYVHDDDMGYIVVKINQNLNLFNNLSVLIVLFIFTMINIKKYKKFF